MRLTPRTAFIVILFLGLFLMTLRPVTDPDFWWHLRTGQWIVENAQVPHSDPFSSTKAGEPWVAHEWLSELAMYGLYRLGGYGLLIAAFSAIITLAFWVCYRRCTPEAAPYAAGFALLLGALASAPTWGARPQMITLLLFSAVLWTLDRFRSRRDWKVLLILPVMTLLWVNLHAGYLVGLGTIGLYAGAELLEVLPALFRGEKPNLRPAGWLFSALLASGLAALANPNGLRLLTYPFETLTSPSMMQFIQEWFSPDFHRPEWQPTAWLLLALAGGGLLARRPVPLAHLLTALFFGYAALRSMRNVPLFAIAAVPVLAEQLAGFLRLPMRAEAPPLRLPAWLPVPFVAVVLFLAGVRLVQVVEGQARAEAGTYPAAAVDWLLENHPPGTLFNPYGWGGYLIWRLYPEYPVYVDGRADLYGDAFLYEFVDLYKAGAKWEAGLGARGVNTVLVEADEPLDLALNQSSDWQAAYRDDQAAIFIRR